jgi:F-type H+-transporting ATPase subunit beta
MAQSKGNVSQVIGPVVDIHFESEDGRSISLPRIHEALVIPLSGDRELVVEVQQHIGENTVRTVAMDSTDGLKRGIEVRPVGSPILMPAGDQLKGRLLNVTGQPIDGLKPVEAEDRLPIHEIRLPLAS